MHLRLAAVAVLLTLAAGGASAQTQPATAPAPLPANSALRATALIVEAKKSQDWFAKVKSYRMVYDVQSARVAAARGAAMPAPGVALRQIAELAFDEQRLYFGTTSAGDSTVIYWDGKFAGRSLRADAFELTDSPEGIALAFRTNVLWGRNGQTYWWTAKRTTQDDFIGATAGYQLVKTAAFHETECYVLRNVPNVTTCYIGVADRRLYGIENHSHVEWYADYKEVAPGCWFPMTIGTEFILPPKPGEPPALSPGDTWHITEVEVDKPLPARLFLNAVKDGTRVHEAIGGSTRDYVYHSAQTPAELAEVQADAARRKVFGPPPHPPGQSISLGGPLDPLPLNPLALHPAAEFPADAKWLNGKPLKLADCHGKIVLVYFWATWQDFSEGIQAFKRAVPDFKLPDALKDQVIIVGVHVPTTEPERVEKALKDHGLPFATRIDVQAEKNTWGAMAEQYRVDELPTTYVIDAEGKVAALGTWNEAIRRAGELLGKAP